MLAAAPVPGTDAWWVLERSVALVLGELGEVRTPPRLPRLDDGVAPVERYLYAWVYAACVPALRRWHAERRIDGAITTASLVDVGRQMVHTRRRQGTGGLCENTAWPGFTLGGSLVQLGRLQFERTRVGRTTAAEMTASGRPTEPGTPVLGVHVPDFSGPLDPAECDASFALARGFFAEHFPEERYDVAMCHSWLLAPQLADYLPASSNVLAFQRRFTVTQRDGEPHDDSFFTFVFGRPAGDIDSLPQDTAVQRALVAHLRSGEHWHDGHGWLAL
ncbi:conserved hypothetical protein [Beutenbergia cavernae DSM 12333]|uniref:Acyltransferase n=1 Tax=Beutenbergia cavernae (strain ATCC BAA-8 / DSM 12333 / CCUG 43141 / JCM 11478 / NBRC 16432 / NCIMB 13614 / HKI 0122) TaxID=471853 RepID=C5C5A1_BEUC1|nr:conserved hypothetical protein [Beutenbergia cavernae DSM 12333]